jgi:hypothetical protein
MGRRKIVHFRRGDALLIIDVINDLQFPGGEETMAALMTLSVSIPASSLLERIPERGDDSKLALRRRRRAGE